MDKDKLQFARNYNKIKDILKNRDKINRDVKIGMTVPALSIPFFAILISPVFWLCLIAYAGIFLGVQLATYFGNKLTIEDCSKSCNKQFSYREYKEMKKSGELDKLLKRVEEIEQEKFAEEFRNNLPNVGNNTYCKSSLNSNEKIENIEQNNTL